MKINSPLFFINDHNGAGACLTVDAQINAGTITPSVGGTLSVAGSSAIGGIDNIARERYEN